MKKERRIPILVLGAAALIGFYTVGSIWEKERPDSSPIGLRRLEDGGEPGLSPVSVSFEYVQARESVELKFHRTIAMIDGVVFKGDDLAAELAGEKKEKNAKYLIIVFDEDDQFGHVIENIDRFRRLGFERVYLMVNRNYDPDTNSWRQNE